jgi:hypothetical protein
MNIDGRFAARLTTGFAICVAAGLAAACSGSNGGFNDPVQDVLGDPLVMMGLKVDPTKEEIEYGPRSPLVMPSSQQESKDLPPPVASGTTEVLQPQWPKDPDAERKKQEAEMRKVAMQEKPRDVEYASAPMTPQDLDEWGKMYGKTNGSGVSTGTTKRYGGKDENKVVSPRELLDRRKDPNQLLQAEPARASLNEPPPGYRTPAPPVDGYAQPEQKKKGFFSKLFGGNG